MDYLVKHTVYKYHMINVRKHCNMLFCLHNTKLINWQQNQLK